MGQTFSLEHENNEDLPSTKAILLLTYECGNLKPLSFLDFIKAPVIYTSSPILMIEPLDGAPAPLVESHQDKMSHTDLLRTVHQTYRITPYQFKKFRLWLFAAYTVSQTLIHEVIEFSRCYNFSSFVSTAAVDASSVFYDLGKQSKSLSSIMRPPSSLRASSPMKPTTQLAQNPLILRRSQQRPQQTLPIQTTFMTIPNNDLNQISTSTSSANAYDLVDDGLYIGSEMAAANKEMLKEIGITHIVNLNGHNTAAAFPDGFQYYTVKMSDSCFEELDEEFWKAVDFTKNAILKGGRVLVHCRLGISRSAALCVAYLMEKKKMTFDQAFASLKSKRPAVNINQGFVEQLKSKEQLSKTQPFRGKPPLLNLARL